MALPTTTPAPPAETSGDLVASTPLVDRGDLIYAAYLLLPLRAFMAFGRALGWLEMLVRPRVRRAVRANLEQAFGTVKSNGEIARLTRQACEFRHMRMLLVQVVPLMAARGELEKHFPIQNIENLERAVALGKGAIIIGSHVNSIGLLLAVVQLRRRGYDVRCPSPEQRDAWPPTLFRRWINRRYGAPSSVRAAIGGFYAQFNVRPLVKLLNQKVILVLMGDGWHSVGFVDVDFLGRRLPFTNGPISLARVAGCPLVPTFSVGTPDRLHFEMEQYFTVDRDAPATDEIERQVTRFIGRVEKRMLADVPSWQHWFEEDMFSVLERWRTTSLRERYAL